MPCTDCVEIKAELAAQKTFISQWFSVFLKEIQTVENQATGFQLEILSRLQKLDQIPVLQNQLTSFQHEVLEKLQTLQAAIIVQDRKDDPSESQNPEDMEDIDTTSVILDVSDGYSLNGKDESELSDQLDSAPESAAAIEAVAMENESATEDTSTSEPPGQQEDVLNSPGGATAEDAVDESGKNADVESWLDDELILKLEEDDDDDDDPDYPVTVSSVTGPDSLMGSRSHSPMPNLERHEPVESPANADDDRNGNDGFCTSRSRSSEKPRKKKLYRSEFIASTAANNVENSTFALLEDAPDLSRDDYFGYWKPPAKKHTLKVRDSSNKKRKLPKVKKHHKAMKLLHCRLCSKVTHHRGVVKEHSAAHLGLKPFKCVHCGQTMNDRSNCKKHMRMMHKHELNHEPGWAMDPGDYKYQLRDKIMECFGINWKV